MKDGFRQCMAWLHTWTGLVVGWVLYFVFVTGTAGYFYMEIDRWMRPELPLATAMVPATQAAALAQVHLQQKAPKAESWAINFQGGRNNPNLTVSSREPRKPGEPRRRGGNNVEALDTVTGEVIGGKPRETGGGLLLYRMHYQLHYFEYNTAVLIVGACTMLMLLAIITGVITHKKIFKDFFTFRPAKGQRSWLDAHNLISVGALPFFLMITYSGLVFFMFNYMPGGVAGVYGIGERDRFYDELYEREERPVSSGKSQPLVPLQHIVEEAERAWGTGQLASLSVQFPNDANARIVAFRQAGATVTRSERFEFDASGHRTDHAEDGMGAARATQDTVLALHEGRFAGDVLRWLYFVSGVLGAAMIATGLVLWTVKRRPLNAKAEHTSFGHKLVERLNIATVAGLPAAIAAYFWANRLIPVDFADRRDWEAHALFIVWGLCFLHAGLRPLMRAWVEQLRFAATMFALLPLLNVFTTDRHLGVTLGAGDGALAGFDLTALVLGALLFVAAIKVERKRVAVPAPKRKSRAARASESVASDGEPA